MMLRVAFIVVAMSTPASAMIACPTSHEGHPLSHSDGASLYLGNPADQMLLAPTRQARTMSESNVWSIDGQSTTLVCKYDGTSRALAQRVPPGTRSCVQNLSANTMVCQ